MATFLSRATFSFHAPNNFKVHVSSFSDIRENCRVFIHAGDRDSIQFTDADFGSCLGRFDLFDPARTYSCLTASNLCPKDMDTMAADLPTLQQLLREVPSPDQQQGARVEIIARLGVVLFHGMADTLRSQSFTPTDFKDWKHGRDYRTQFCPQLKDELLPVRTLLERDGFQRVSERDERDVEVVRPQHQDRYQITTTDRDDVRLTQTQGAFPDCRHLYTGKRSQIDIYNVGDLESISIQFLNVFYWPIHYIAYTSMYDLEHVFWLWLINIWHHMIKLYHCALSSMIYNSYYCMDTVGSSSSSVLCFRTSLYSSFEDVPEGDKDKVPRHSSTCTVL